MANPPPSREIEEFQFRLCCRLQTTQPKIPLNCNSPVKLVTASTKYGLIFVTHPTGVHVIRTASILALQSTRANNRSSILNYPRRDLKLTSQPTHLDLNADNELLAVVSTLGEYPVLHVYSVPSFAAANIVKKYEVRLSTTPSYVVDLQWNPGVPNLLCVVLSDGSACCYEFSVSSFSILGNVPPASQSLCCCWSPKGKQVVIGDKNGCITQYKPDLKAVKCTQPPKFDDSVSAVSVHWVSSPQFIVAYKNLSDESKRPSLVIVNLVKNAPPNYINYDDICYGTLTKRPEHFFIHETKWNVLLIGNANSMEVSVLHLEGENWEQWVQDASNRAELPLTDDHRDVHNLGIALDLSSQMAIPVGENKTIDPMPLLLMLSHEGVLSIFHMVNLFPNAPRICTPPQNFLDQSGLQMFTENQVGDPQPAAQQAHAQPFQAQGQAFSPQQTVQAQAGSFLQQQQPSPQRSLFGASGVGEVKPLAAASPPHQPTSQPASLFSSFSPATTSAPLTDTSSFFNFSKPAGTSPAPTSTFSFSQTTGGSLFGGSMSQPPSTTAGPSLFGFKTQAPSGTGQLAAEPPNTGIPFGQQTTLHDPPQSKDPSQPLLAVPASPAPSPFFQPPKPPPTLPPPSFPPAVSKTPAAPSTSSLFGNIQSAQPSTGFSFSQSFSSSQPTASTPIQAPQHPQVQSPSSVSLQQRQPSPTSPPAETTPKARKPALQATRRTSETQESPKVDVSTYQTAIQDEVSSFQDEFNSLKALIKSVKVHIADEEVKTRLIQDTVALVKFGQDLSETTMAQQVEVNALKSNVIEVFGWVESVRAKKRLLENPKFQSFLEVQELDPVSKKWLNSIEHHLYYLESQIKQATIQLNHIWTEQQKKGKDSIGLKTPTMETIYQAITLLNNIIAAHKMAVVSLESKMSCNVKQLKNKMPDISDIFEPKKTASSSESQLSNLADKLLQTKLGDSGPNISPSYKQSVSKFLIISKSQNKVDCKKLKALRDWHDSHQVIYTKGSQKSQYEDPMSPGLGNTTIGNKMAHKLSLLTKSALEEKKDQVQQHKGENAPVELTKILRDTKVPSAPKSDLAFPSKDKENAKPMPPVEVPKVSEPTPVAFTQNKHSDATLSKGDSVTSKKIVFVAPNSQETAPLQTKPSSQPFPFTGTKPSPTTTSASVFSSTSFSNIFSGSLSISAPTAPTTNVAVTTSSKSSLSTTQSSVFQTKPASATNIFSVPVTPSKVQKPNANTPTFSFGSAPSISEANKTEAPSTKVTPSTTSTAPASIFGGALLSNSQTSSLFKPPTSSPTLTAPVSSGLPPSVPSSTPFSFASAPLSSASSSPLTLDTAVTSAPSSFATTLSAVSPQPGVLDKPSDQPQVTAPQKTPAISSPASTTPASTTTIVSTLAPVSPSVTSSTSLQSSSSLDALASLTSSLLPSVTTSTTPTTLSGSTFGTSLFGSVAVTSGSGQSLFGSAVAFSGSKSGASIFGTGTPSTTAPAFGTSLSFAAPKFGASQPFGASSTTGTVTTTSPAPLSSTTSTTVFPTTIAATTASFSSPSTTGAFSAPTPPAPSFVSTTSAGNIFGFPASSIPSTTSAPAFPPPSTTGAFGTSTTSSPSFGAAPTTTGSLFGSTSTPSPNLFGTPLTSAPTFGTPVTSPSAFGTVTTASSAFPTPATTAPLFGSPSTTSTFGTATTSSAFGTPATSSSLFGTPTTTFASSSSTPMFGSGSAFGTPSTSANTFFGQAICSPTSKSGGSIFGQSSFGQPAASTAASSIFGGNDSFSSKTTFGQAGDIFKPQTSTGAFGSSGGSFFSGGSTFGSASQSGGNLFQSSSSGGPFSASPNVTAASPGGFGSPPAFQKPAGAFGASSGPLFGSPPSFGSAPTFGGSPSFGATASAFGGATQQSPSFGNLNEQNTLSFGNLAQGQPSAFGGATFGGTQPNQNPFPTTPQFGGSSPSWTSWRS